MSEGGFVIDGLTISGFMRYVQKSAVEFPKGLTVITGRTGSGKTSIIDAITFALYKQTTRTDAQVNIDGLFGDRGGYVTLRFRQEGHGYEVTRGIDAKKKPYLTLKLDGGRLAGGIAELDERIKEIVGLDYLGFRNSTFVRQEEMRQLGSESGSRRLKIIQQLFRLEIFEKAREEAAEKARQGERQINGLEAKLDEMRREHSRLPSIMKEIGLAEASLEPLKKEAQDLGAMIEKAKGELVRLKSAHDRFIAMKETLAGIKDAADDARTKIAKLEHQLEKASAVKKKISEIEPQAARFDGISAERDKVLSELEGLREKKSAADLANEKLASLRNQAGEIEAMYREQSEDRKEKLEGYRMRLSSLSTDIGADEAFALLRTEGALAERVDRILKELGWLDDRKELVTELRKEKTDAESSLSDVSKKTKAINADSFAVQGINAEIDDLEKEAEGAKKRYHSKMDRLEKEMEKARSGTTQAAADGALEKAIKENEKRSRELARDFERGTRLKRELDELKSELYRGGDIQKQLDDCRAQLAGKEKEADEKSQKLKEMENLEKQYAEAGAEAERIEAKERGAHEELVKRETGLKWLGKEAERLKKLGEDVGKMEDERKKLLGEFEVHEVLSKNVFHSTGVVRHAVSELLPHLESTSSQYLAALTDGRLSKIKLESYIEKKEYGIAIDIEGPGGEWRDVAEFSGGEKTQINAALRFAIAEELAGIVQFRKMKGRMKTLMIDEGDLGSLDTDLSRQLFVNKLLDMSRFFEKVVLITHLEEVAERFDNRISVHMNPEHESTVRVEGKSGQ